MKLGSALKQLGIPSDPNRDSLFLGLSVCDSDDLPVVAECHYCEQLTDKPTRDHIVPKSKGGQDKYYNRVIVCEECNKSKGATLPQRGHCGFCNRTIDLHDMITKRGHSKISQRARVFGMEILREPVTEKFYFQSHPDELYDYTSLLQLLDTLDRLTPSDYQGRHKK